MGWRRKPRTVNEELLAEGWREAEPEAAAAPADRQQAQARLILLALWVAGAFFLLGLKWVVEFLPAWAQFVVGVLVVAHFLLIFMRSTRNRSSGAANGLRALFLIWLAICIAATALIAIGGFQQDDRALLGVLWPILGLIWIAYRLRRAAASPQPGMGSRSHSP
jgi:hypothetical protein